jgi:hypothetical protein
MGACQVAAQLSTSPFLLAILQPTIFGVVGIMAVKHIREIANVAGVLIAIMGRSIPRLLAGLLILAFVAYVMHDAALAFDKMIENIREVRLLDGLTSTSNAAKVVALEELTKPGLIKPDEAAGIAASIVVHEPSSDVRAAAERTLKKLAESRDPAAQAVARAALDREKVASELRSRNLLRVVSNAEAYVAQHSGDGDEKAFQMYAGVVDRISPEARSHLDPDLLARAENARRKGSAQEAVPLYYRMFEQYSVH